MDSYVEQIMLRKPTARENLMMAGSIALLVGGLSIWLFLGKGSIGLSLALIGGILIACSKRARNLEYEYIFTNDDCEITRIVNKESRKPLYNFRGGDIQRVLLYSSGKYDNLLASEQTLAIRDYTSGLKGNEEHWYVFVNNGTGKTLAIVMELSERTEEYVKTVFKKKLDM